MSGGVDSSVTAFLLKEQGYEVIAIFMKNWEELDGSCHAAKDHDDVVRVCQTLKIPHYTLNFTKAYKELVFSRFLKELKLGYTPNPDILCNQEIKFKLFFEKAVELGADYLSTGHYAQTSGGSLFKSIDKEKDQTYFLYTLKKEILKKLLFPIGSLKKEEVRRIAQNQSLATATKKDSTGICFIGERRFRQFLGQYIPYQEGNLETLSGKVMGKHQGVPFYTIGQRKGLQIGGQAGRDGKAWFVVGKDLSRNVVYVEQGDDHPALYRSTLKATELSWIQGKPPNPLPFSCQAKIRYRQTDQPCVIESIEKNEMKVSFSIPQRAITPRQSIVFYNGSLCLGGAIIAPDHA